MDPDCTFNPTDAPRRCVAFVIEREGLRILTLLLGLGRTPDTERVRVLGMYYKAKHDKKHAFDCLQEFRSDLNSPIRIYGEIPCLVEGWDDNPVIPNLLAEAHNVLAIGLILEPAASHTSFNIRNSDYLSGNFCEYRDWLHDGTINRRRIGCLRSRDQRYLFPPQKRPSINCPLVGRGETDRQ